MWREAFPENVHPWGKGAHWACNKALVASCVVVQHESQVALSDDNMTMS